MTAIATLPEVHAAHEVASAEVLDRETASLALAGGRKSITPEALEAFAAAIDGSDATRHAYTRGARLFFEWLRTQPSRSMAHPVKADVMAFRDAMLEKHTAATAQNYLVCVRRFFAFCEENGLYDDIAKRVKSVRLDKSHKKDFLSVEQVKDVFNEVRGDSEEELRNFALCAVLFTTGIRTVEAVRCRAMDLHRKAGVTLLDIQIKGSHERGNTVRLSPETEKAVRMYLAYRGNPTGEEPLFASVSNRNRGGRMTTDSISRIVKTAFRRVGLDSPRLTAHSARATAATQAYAHGADLFAVQKLLHHRNPATTEIYIADLEELSGKCEGLLSKAFFD